MSVEAIFSIVVGVVGILLSISTFTLNLILKEIKELRQSIQALVHENALQRERIVRLEECFKGLKCKECTHG